MSDDLEQRRIRAQQAREAIDSAGWAFDEYVRQQWTAWLNTPDTDEGQKARERLWRSAHIAMRAKEQLILTINSFDNEEALREHRNRTA